MTSVSRALVIFTSDLYEGGVAESSRKIIDAFAQVDCELHVVIYDRLPIKKSLDDGVQVHELCIPMSLGFTQGFLKKIIRSAWRVIGIWQAKWRLQRYLKTIDRPVTVYSLTYFPNLIAMKAVTSLRKSGADIHLVTSERQDPIKDLVEKDSLSARMLLKSLRVNYHQANCIHVNSTEMLGSVASAYQVPREKMKLIYNFFDLNYLKNKSQETNVLFGDYVLCVGRISEQKGHWHALELYVQMRQQGYTGRLVVLGKGPLKAFIEARVSQHKLNSEILFIDNLDNPYPIIKGADALLFPSLWESFGNVIVESMALRTLVCASPCQSGPGELLLNGKAGILLELYPKITETEFDSPSYRAQIESDAKKICNVLSSVLTVNELLDAGELRARDFSTENAVQEFTRMFRLDAGDLHD